MQNGSCRNTTGWFGRLGFAAFAALLLATQTLASLSRDIDAVLADDIGRKYTVGVVVVEVGDSPAADRRLYERNPTQALIPASNLKVVTTAAALDVLGPDFRFRTVLAGNGQDLALIGDGDPTLGDSDFLRTVGWEVDTVFTHWAQVLKDRNVTSAQRLLVDDSVFDETFLHPNWPMDQVQFHYVAEVGGVNLNVNCLDFYLRNHGRGQVVSFETVPDTDYANVNNVAVGGANNAVHLSRQPGTNDISLGGETKYRRHGGLRVTIHDPPRFAATYLAEVLDAAGVRTPLNVQRDRTVRSHLDGRQNGWVALAVHETPLVTALARSNKDSVNVYAESLVKRMGYATAGGAPGDWTNGTAAVEAYLARLGLPAAEYDLDDGSGLSRQNRVSANAVATVLADAFHRPYGATFVGTMSVSGTDGTLSRRFDGLGLTGRVKGKSGFINNVSSLSGYVEARNGKTYVFAVLMNDVPLGQTWKAKQMQERIVHAIDKNAR